MGIALTFVVTFSNASISMIRSFIPNSVRIILQVTIIATGVIVVDEVLKAFAPGAAKTLSVFIGLIVTNCIILGRAEAFAMHNSVAASLSDALGNGIGYGVILLFVATARELLGFGSLFDIPVLPLLVAGGWYRPNEMMLYAPSAFFLIGLLIWGVRAWRAEQVERPEYPPPQMGDREAR